MAIKKTILTEETAETITGAPVVEGYTAKRSPRKIGNNVEKGKEQESIIFLSTAKSLNVMLDHSNIIQFANYHYTTSDPIDIDYLRNNSSFGIEIFEKEYPQWVREKMAKDRKDQHEIPEEHFD